MGDHEDEGTNGVSGLGDAMGRVARQLQEEHGNVEETLKAITASAVRTVPNAEECGISYVIGRRKVQPRASTSELPRAVDDLQGRIGQGPCLDAVWEQPVVRVDDVAADERWPRFAKEAPELGVRSMLCFRLFVEQDRLGALNLYSREPHAFDEEAEEIGQLFASHAAVALAGAEHEEQLRTGMSHRDVIGQAKGILMERHKITADQAFGVLARVSQEMNRRLLDIAVEMTGTGSLPEEVRPHR
ncbi:GAF and ANTAR domain-containing protein [Modestobacter sp. URMC 112]